MLPMLFAIAGTGLVLLTSEYLCRKRILKGEYARKFVHIITATFAAFWPLFLSHYEIAILSLLFAVAVVVIKKFKLLRSFRAVRRVGYGELWYALGIGLVALLFQDSAIYSIAILHMALADGFAAVVGVGLGKKAVNYRYRHATKSVAGTTTFFGISFALNLYYWLVVGADPFAIQSVSAFLPIMLSIGAATILSFAEVISPKGSDNVIVPVLAGALLWLPTVVS